MTKSVDRSPVIERSRLPGRPYPIAAAFDLAAERLSMLAIRDVHRFDDLVARLGSVGDNANSLQRLPGADIPVTAQYDSRRRGARSDDRMRERGREPRHGPIALGKSSDHHLLRAGNEQRRLVPRATGHRVRQQLVNAEGGEPVEGRRNPVRALKPAFGALHAAGTP